MESGGFVCTFPALTAAQWLELLAEGNWPVRVLHRIPDDQYDAFLSLPDLDRARLMRLSRLILETAGGRRWWEVQRVAESVISSPQVLGAVLLRGVDPERMTLAAFVCVVWALLTQSGDDMQRAQAEMELTMPPPEALEDEPEPVYEMQDLVTRMRSLPGVSVG